MISDMWNTVPAMSPAVPAHSTPPLTDTLARRVVERTVADRHRELAGEMRRIVEATFELVERTGDLEVSMRQILAHTGLSTQAFYRHFRSKDELMLALLDDGRRRLVDTLQRRMDRVTAPSAQVRAWIEGVLAQATDTRAAARTRPFVTGEARLAEMFPDEHRTSVALLVDLLRAPVEAMGGTERDAQAIYRLTFATLHDHLIERRKPQKATVDHVVGFALRAMGGPK